MRRGGGNGRERGCGERKFVVLFLRGEGGEEGGEGGYAKICHGDKRGSVMTISGIVKVFRI